MKVFIIGDAVRCLASSFCFWCSLKCSITLHMAEVVNCFAEYLVEADRSVERRRGCAAGGHTLDVREWNHRCLPTAGAYPHHGVPPVCPAYWHHPSAPCECSTWHSIPFVVHILEVLHMWFISVVLIVNRTNFKNMGINIKNVLYCSCLLSLITSPGGITMISKMLPSKSLFIALLKYFVYKSFYR